MSCAALCDQALVSLLPYSAVAKLFTCNRGHGQVVAVCIQIEAKAMCMSFFVFLQSFAHLQGVECSGGVMPCVYSEDVEQRFYAS